MVSIPPGSSLGRYRVIEQLGRGGMATVFRCHDPNLDRYVAVKVLPSYHTEDPTFVARFTQEAQTVARLSHPNILQIFDFGEDKGFTYIVTELILGGDLQDRLSGEPLPIEEVLDFMGPLADALDYAHGQGIVHRDIKPGNVLLDLDNRPILADFGLARMLASSTRFTQASQALGTPEYMAPEQAMGADADNRSDLYAFGVMLYQMLLGQTPFRADTPAATLMAHVHKPLPLPTALNPNVDRRVESILLKSLAKEPQDRFQSAKEMVQALGMTIGRARVSAAEEGLGATAVMDTAELGTEGAMEAATAVIGHPPAAAGVAQAEETARPVEAAPKPAAMRRWIIPGGGVVALIAVVAVIAVILAGGLDGETDTEGVETIGEEPLSAGPSDTVAPSTEAVFQASEEKPAPAMTLAETVAALEGLISRTQANVATLRDITLDEEIKNVNIEFKTREELASITRSFYKREDIRQQIFEAEELYKALDLMDRDQDLEDILLGIQLQQVYALYDDQAEKVYVISEAAGIGAFEELAIAAASMGDIQQTLFDISRLRKASSKVSADQYRALDALIIGDVAGIVTAYVSTFFTRDQMDELQQPLPENKLLAAPRVVREANRFPQMEGRSFVSDLYGTESKGWEGVNEAYTRPPASTEQVIHPEKYFADEQPNQTTLPNFANQMGKGWSQVSANTLGEFLLRTYLEEYLDEKLAADAAAGWGGDRYSLLSGPEGEQLLILAIMWDSFEDSVEFFEAYQIYYGIKTQGTEVTSSRTQSERRWVTPDETVFLVQSGPLTMLLIGDQKELVEQGLQLLGESLREEFVP